MNTDELCIGPTATSNPAIPCKLVHMWRDFFSPIVLSKVEFSMVRAIEAPIVVPTEKTLSKEINARILTPLSAMFSSTSCRTLSTRLSSYQHFILCRIMTRNSSRVKLTVVAYH
jgi:hypothetical protein